MTQSSRLGEGLRKNNPSRFLENLNREQKLFRTYMTALSSYSRGRSTNGPVSVLNVIGWSIA